MFNICGEANMLWRCGKGGARPVLLPSENRLYVYVCMYVCIYIYIHVYIYVYVCMCVLVHFSEANTL